MFGLFNRDSKKEKLQKKYEQLMKELFMLSSKNSRASDAKLAEAEIFAKRIADLPH